MYGLRIEHPGLGPSDLPGTGWAELHRTLTIGRGGDNNLILQDSKGTISKRHCTITAVDGKCVLTDHSRNGTFVNGSRQAVETSVPLKAGDVLRIGAYELSLVAMSGAETPEISDRSVESLSERSLLGAVMRPHSLPGDHFNPGATGALFEPAKGVSGTFGSMALSSDDSLLLAPIDRDAGTFSTLNPAPTDVDGMIYIQPRLSTESIPDDWDLLADLRHAPMSLAVRESNALDTDEETDGKDPEPLPTSPVAKPPNSDEAAAVAAFFHGCGLDDRELDRSDLSKLLQRAGQALRVTILNLQKEFLCEERASLPQVLDQGVTNPFTLSADPSAVLFSLLSPSLQDLPSAHEVIDRAFGELRRERVSADVEARQRLRCVLDRLAPATITRNGTENDRFRRHVPVLQHAKYWQAYEASFRELLTDIEAHAKGQRNQ